MYWLYFFPRGQSNCSPGRAYIRTGAKCNQQYASLCRITAITQIYCSIVAKERSIWMLVNTISFSCNISKRPIFTAPNSSCGKVMFSQASVCHSVQVVGVGAHPRGGYSPPSPYPPPPSGYMNLGYYGIRLTSGLYASYWNAFLLVFQFLSLLHLFAI